MGRLLLIQTLIRPVIARQSSINITLKVALVLISAVVAVRVVLVGIVMARNALRCVDIIFGQLNQLMPMQLVVVMGYSHYMAVQPLT